jgi:hypothetical protein
VVATHTEAQTGWWDGYETAAGERLFWHMIADSTGDLSTRIGYKMKKMVAAITLATIIMLVLFLLGSA